MRKKSTTQLDDDMRIEYKRSDFGVMERGKYVHLARLALEGERAANIDIATSPEKSRESEVSRIARRSDS